MNTRPNPAVVGQRAARQLPRLALYLLCLAYIIPGLLGRDPWKAAEISAVGHMLALVRGETAWLSPALVGFPSDGSVLPYGLGALSIQWLEPLGGEAFAARLPFAFLLLATLTLTWYATYYLARSEAAQPLAYAFGGEAHPIDYARAIADGSILALMASLGLLQLGHETTPELMQMFAIALLLLSLAISPYRPMAARWAVVAAPIILAASGAASTALLLTLGCAVIAWKSSAQPLRQLLPWVGVAALASAGTATLCGAWITRLALTPSTMLLFPKLLVWFAWPAWPLAAWTLWRWRLQLNRRHIALPLMVVLIMLGISLGMGNSDRALMLALPGMAVLAAFALPTLQRSFSAAIDWFSVFFFSFCALTIWVIYIAIQTGIPKQPAANVARLAPEFVSRFDPWALIWAALATVTWLWLVRWRTGRHQEALWKSLVLPASGVALSWLLLMTLWLPLLDHARSYRMLIERVAQHIPAHACVVALDLTRGQTAALQFFGPDWHVVAHSSLEAAQCPWRIQSVSMRHALAAAPTGWRFVHRERRPTDDEESLAIYRHATTTHPTR
ncbi:hypothetical protein [Leptothrix ochracea]|uniref:hypothetical protein n=1 Tax=Leptothrix ochracea TaxID=735331 RepID=UPI0012EA5AC3|nr:hypothetical protein [Leptothrix ochracea]